MGNKTKGLLARLNTYESLSAATPDRKRFGQGIYVDFGDYSAQCEDMTFRDIIREVVDEALELGEREHKEIARCVRLYAAQKVPQVIVSIRVYDLETGEFVRNKKDYTVLSMGLDEKIKDYITEKEVALSDKPQKVDYLDMVMALIAWD